MIPKILKIKGLYSFTEEQTIDFSKLIEAQLFGIFGAVGSGKSTILEAISFAIFGKTERFSTTGDDRYYNMMNLKSNETKIDFTFVAGKANKTYQSISIFKRHKTKFDEVKNQPTQFYEIIDNQQVPVEHEVILHEVGVSYNNFKRTIIIPQGKFREFLELIPSERTKMLKELFGLYKYDFSDKTNKLQAANNHQRDTIAGHLQSFLHVNTANINQLQIDLSGVEHHFLKLKNDLSVLEEVIHQNTILKENRSKLAALKLVFEKNAIQKKQDDSLEKEIDTFEKYQSIFNQVFVSLREVRDHFESKQQSYNHVGAAILSKEQEIAEILPQLETLEAQNQTHESEKQKAIELDKMSEIIDLLKTQSTLNLKNADFSKKITAIQQEIQYKQGFIQQLMESNMQLKTAIFPESMWYQLKIWYDALRQINQNIQKHNTEWDNLQKQQVAVKEWLQVTNFGVFEPNFAQLSEDYTYDEFEKIVAITQKQWQDAVYVLKDNLSKTQIKHELSVFSLHLHHGKPCLLCGATSHPNPLKPIDNHDEILDLEQKISHHEKAIQDLWVWNQKMRQNWETTTVLQSKLLTIQNEISSLENQKAVLITQMPDPNFAPEDEEKLIVIEKESQQNQKKLNQNLTLIDEATSALVAQQKELATAIDRWNELKLEINAAETTMAIKKSEVRILNVNDYSNQDKNQIIAAKNQIIAQIAQNESDLKQLLLIKYEAENELLILKGQLQSLEHILAEIKFEESKHNQTLQLKLAENQLDRAEVVRVLKQKWNTVEERKKIAETRATYHKLEGEITALQKVVDTQVFDNELFEKQNTQYRAMKTDLDITNQKIGKIADNIKTLQSQLIEKNKLEQQLHQLEIRAENLNILSKLFRANGFVEFVSKRYLKNVIALANSRFHIMVRQKYQLEMDENGHFLVRDFLNGGKTRLLKSLSGGQIFQAALCLALALSESIQKNANIDQHFFFLDEGFGSLDKDSLQIVLETLKSLQKENRIVGLISHVEDLQQEVDVFLHIRNDASKSSVIDTSY
ncbi:SbcC/MukB-like Walker B domain-containing protein [Flavobacterium branchiophilum]|uniref:Rad50/SbcC-type AAA domain-containing protein n=1 Tax=Flavobacterium branchiophilum TaxID=55197 RepID=A0A2H3KFA2_9FLAO|nr:SMC family ATPase [Flavobacterium branchiophilum]PDS21809.1 hypothetical protein B0A77_15050 [Flavobacterium branchiophilum]